MNVLKKVLKSFLFRLFENYHIIDIYRQMISKIENVIESKYDMDYDGDFDCNDLSDKQLNENSVIISFVGELILLRYQLCAGWTGCEYDFSPLFRFTKDIFNECNFNIGVLEGPVCDQRFSNGDFLDGSDLRLNYPYNFLESIKEAGIDFVSIANNHMYDMGPQGAYETVENLKKAGLDYIGINLCMEERQNVKIVYVEGIKIAVLAYMDGQNKIPKEYFIDGENSYESALIVSVKDKAFRMLKTVVEEDFKRARKENPDLIVVIPHMGKLGSLHTSNMQKVWNDIFVQNGADIILTASSHSVQPIEWKRYNNKFTLIVNSPGNYVNSRTNDDNDDASAIVKIYVDRQTKSLKMCSIVPMYATSSVDGLFVPIPIHKINSDLSVRRSLSVYDYKRVREVQKIITRTMLGRLSEN